MAVFFFFCLAFHILITVVSLLCSSGGLAGENAGAGHRQTDHGF